MGHNSVTTTMKYVHLARAQKVESIKKLDAFTKLRARMEEKAKAGAKASPAKQGVMSNRELRPQQLWERHEEEEND
jgi:hypothetical protein